VTTEWEDPAWLVQGTGHGVVLAAVRRILADGHARSAAEICRAGIAQSILAPTTIPAYVEHAIATLLDRQRDRGERAEFVVLPDGRYRRNVPLDPFEHHRDAVSSHPGLDALVARLRSDVVRAGAADGADHAAAGAPFEESVAAAMRFLGFEAQRLGGQGQPDVVATAPLGDRAYRIAFECKTFAAQKLPDSAAFVVEAARLRDAVGAEHAVLIGLGFPDVRALDDEMLVHRVATWTVDDLVNVLTAHADHPIPWSRLPVLLEPGRARTRVDAFVEAAQHGARKRARVTLQLLLEVGLDYQLSLVRADSQVERVSAPLTVEALVVLINERLAAESDLGRVGVDDVRRAIAFASDPLVDAVSVDGEAIYVERRIAPEQS
jgi:hypothetical protein